VSKNTEKHKSFVENNRRIANSIGTIFASIFALALAGSLLYQIGLFFRKVLTELIGFEQLKAVYL
jgi:hypothetical protein